MSKPQTPQAPSVLMAMHRRYEQAVAEYEIIDTAHQSAKDNGEDDAFLLYNASQASVREADALRIAILYQVPATTAEAAVLQFHISNMHDMIEGCTDRRELEEEALKVAIQTIFDCLTSEIKEDVEQFAGASFRDEAARAYFARSRRTGGMEV